MRKNTKSVLLGNNDGNGSGRAAFRLDELDIKIISLLVQGRNNRDICKELGVPLSTIQRRTRIIFEKELLTNRVELNYKKLGLSKGLAHLYLGDGDALQTAKKLMGVDGVVSVSIHIGNSDVVGEIVYRDSVNILNLLSQIKRISGVQKVVWSEEIYYMPVDGASSRMLAKFLQQNGGSSGSRRPQPEGQQH